MKARFKRGRVLEGWGKGKGTVFWGKGMDSGGGGKMERKGGVKEGGDSREGKAVAGGGEVEENKRVGI